MVVPATPVWGVFDSADWQRSLNAINANPVYANIDQMAGTPMSATHPQLSWANGLTSAALEAEPAGQVDNWLAERFRLKAGGAPRQGRALGVAGQPVYQALYTPRLEADRTPPGRLSCLTWMSWNLSVQNGDQQFTNETILAGNHDAYIDSFAQAAAAYGWPFVVRFDPEMNGWWEGPFSEYDGNGNIANGNQPGDFVRMWRYVYNRVHAVAPNILWYWCCNPVGSLNVPNPGTAALGGQPTAPNMLQHFYPGDDVVDFVGADLYNWAASRGDPWMYLQDMLEGGKGGYGNTWATIRGFTQKPWIIGEFATHDVATAGDTTPGTGDVAHWFADFYSVLPTKYPQIVGALYYNWGDPTYHWSITQAYATAIGAGLRANGWAKAGAFQLPGAHYGLAGNTSTSTLAALQAQLQAAQQSLAAVQTQLQQAQAALATAQALDATDQAQVATLQAQVAAATASASTATSHAQAAEAAMVAAQAHIAGMLAFSTAAVP